MDGWLERWMDGWMGGCRGAWMDVGVVREDILLYSWSLSESFYFLTLSMLAVGFFVDILYQVEEFPL